MSKTHTGGQKYVLRQFSQDTVNTFIGRKGKGKIGNETALYIRNSSESPTLDTLGREGKFRLA